MNAKIVLEGVGRISACWCAFMLGWMLTAGNARAQTFRGTILGTVQDQSGASVPGAQVTVKNQETGLTRNTTTGDAGNYYIPELPIGEYTVTVEKAGFGAVTQPNVRVGVASEQRVDATLTPAKMQATVEVTAEVPLLQTTTNVLGGTIEGPQVENFPVSGRDYLKLIFVNPGVTGSPDQITDSPGSFGAFSVNGARGRANNFLLDGTDMNDGYRNLPAINEAGVFGTPATILPVDAVAELAVLSNFEPEYGRNAGSVINIVTKSGTNALHGSILEFFRNDALDARNFFNPAPNPKSRFRNNQFGGSVGGPIIRDRTFFFGDYEAQRERVGLASLACVPTPADIAALGGATNPVIAALVQRKPWPDPNIQSAIQSGSCPNVSVSTGAKNRVDSAIVKIDHNFNEKNLLTGRYYVGDSSQSFPLALVGGGILPGFNTLTPTRVQLVSLSYVTVISDTKVNEIRAGWNRFAEDFFPEDGSVDPGSIGLNTGVGKQDFGLPFINVSGFAPIGATTSVPRGRVDQNWQGIDNFSWKIGRHETKLGFEFRRTTVAQFFDSGFRGKINFDSLADFLQGIPSGGRQAFGNSHRNTFQNAFAGYAQDSFRWTPRLTVNAGVRWDFFAVIGEKRGLFSNLDPKLGLVPVGKTPEICIAVVPPPPGCVPIPRLYQRDWNNFAPRVSFAYDLTGKGKTVIRAGYGIFYDVPSQDFFAGQLPFNTFNAGPAFNGIGAAPILFAFDVARDANGDPLPFDPNTPVFGCRPGPSCPASNFAATDVFAVDRRLRTPYLQNYNFNIQQEITRYAVLQVSYVGSQGRKLFRYRDINQSTQALIDAHNPADGCCAGRPFDNGPFSPLDGSQFFYVNQIETTAVSNYNSLQISGKIRGWRKFDSVINYNYSHSIDNASDGQDFVANATQPNNSFRPDLERGNSNFDVRHRFVWFTTYQLPKFNRRWSRMTDGWGLNTVLTLQSGQPFHVNLFDDYDGTGEFFPRPDLVGDPFAGTSSPDRFLNLSAFAVPCTLDTVGDGSPASCIQGTQHAGTLGRNSLRGPNFKQFDLSIFKDTPLNERITLQFRAEFFNLPNRPNFASPLLPGFAADASFNGIDPVTGRGVDFLPLVVTGDVGIGNPFLGGGGPRGIQFALKLMF